MLLLGGEQSSGYVPGFARSAGFPELNADRHIQRAIREQLAAFREGTGPDMDILVDLNFNYKTEGFLAMARAMEPFDLFWVEMDTRDARALHYVRSRTTSVCSAGATIARSSSSSPWTWPSWTRSGTAWPRDVVPWYHDLVTVKPDIKDGYLTIPRGPGWGTEVNEAAVRAHPGR